MAKKRYKAIDKRLITEGSAVDFNLFLPNETKTVMSVFLQSDTVVDGDAKVRLREVEMLYISEEEEERYLAYMHQHIQTIARSLDIPTEEKAVIVYEQAWSLTLRLSNVLTVAHRRGAKG